MLNRPWIKLWVEKWLGSRRIRAARYEELGLYISIVIRAAAAGDNGELRIGDRPWTLEELADDLGLDSRRTARLRKRMERLVDLGLLEILPDGCITVCRFTDLQSREFGKNSKLDSLIGGLARKTRVR